MLPSIEELLRTPESESAEKKSALAPELAADILGLVSDLTAMANTHGGWILVGTDGKPISETHQQLFDSARIDDKVNSFVEPRVGGIKSSMIGKDFVLVEVAKSQTPPHVFRQDGTYMNAQGKNSSLFRKGDVFVRHASKSERATRSDFERWFEGYRRRMFENVKMVFDAGPRARVQIDEGPGSMPVRIDPDAAGAQPVYDLLTPEPFRDLQQELVGGLKSWKTSRVLLNESQIRKAYKERTRVKDPEVIELVLRSCWEKFIPGYWWAAQISPNSLYNLFEEVIRTDAYPSSHEALKVASLLPRTHAVALFSQAENSPRKSTKKLIRKLGSVLRARARKYEALVETIGPGKKLTYGSGEGTKEVKKESVTEATFDEILDTLLLGKRENRGAFKAAELLVFGPRVAALTLPLPQAAAAEGPDENLPAQIESSGESSNPGGGPKA